MKTNSQLLTAAILLLSPALCAYGSSEETSKSSSPITIGAEIQAHMINVGWHTKAASTAAHMDKLTSAVQNASAWAYQDGNDKVPNYAFGGRITGKTSFSDDFSIIVGVGLETGMPDAKGFRPLNTGLSTTTTGNATEDVTVADWNLLDTTGYSVWKNNMVIAPALFLGYGNVALGVQYDMREYVVSGHVTALTTHLDKTLKDNQVLFGFRGEQSYEMDDMNLCFSVEFMTNLGTKADSDVETYFVNLAKYGIDTVMVAAGPILDAGLLSDTQSAYAAPATRAVVSSAHTNLTKASVGIGVMFAEF